MGETEVVSLWCPDHLKLLSEGVMRLFETKYKTDFVISSHEGEHKVEVHQNLLSIFCPNFYDYDGQEFHINHHLNADELNLLLEFFYRGHVSVNKQLMDKLRSAAEELGLQQLVDVIERYKNKAENTGDDVQTKQTKKVKSKIKTTLVERQLKKGVEFLESNSSKDSQKTELEDSPCWVKGEDEKMKDPFQCSQCSYVTNRKDSFRNHLDIHDDDREYICEICTRRFRNRRRYSSHVRSHKNPERMQKCDHCDYQTATRTTLVQHLASRHHVDAQGNELTADVKCSECDFVCVSKFQLRNHRLYKHSIKPFKCSECDFTAVRKTLVEKHLKMKHKNERPFMCETCGFRSKTVSAFHSHLMVHSNSKPFKCDRCAKAYKHNYQLRAHQRSHIGNGKPFLCHICCLAFRRNYEMQMHIKQKHAAVDIDLETEPVDGDVNLSANDDMIEIVMEPYES